MVGKSILGRAARLAHHAYAGAVGRRYQVVGAASLVAGLDANCRPAYRKSHPRWSLVTPRPGQGAQDAGTGRWVQVAGLFAERGKLGTSARLAHHTCAEASGTLYQVRGYGPDFRNTLAGASYRPAFRGRASGGNYRRECRGRAPD